jgi:hypothetical protein
MPIIYYNSDFDNSPYYHMSSPVRGALAHSINHILRFYSAFGVPDVSELDICTIHIHN